MAVDRGLWWAGIVLRPGIPRPISYGSFLSTLFGSTTAFILVRLLYIHNETYLS